MSRTPFEIVPEGSITSTPGFQAAGVACGLKPTGALDLALVYSPTPCTAAAMYTTNAFQSAPVLYDRQAVGEHPRDMHGVVINSGCANACTGERGLHDARDTAAHAGQALGVPGERVAVMSTGVIGAYLPMDKIRAGIEGAVAALDEGVDAGHAAARAIMTTDTRPKEVAVRVRVGDADYTVAGMAKGAGMISPNMATLLCVLTTDAAIDPAPAEAALREAVEAGFNLITVDGDTSTNDTALLLANGCSAAPRITSVDGGAYEAFRDALTHVVVELAKGLVRDGEGASHFVAVRVSGAPSREEAKRVAMSVAKSSLVKTAIYGRDANWGRVACAAGYSGVAIDPARVSIWLGDMLVYREGEPLALDEARAAAFLAETDVSLRIDLGAGNADVTVWTCDLTHAYVDVNAHYRT